MITTRALVASLVMHLLLSAAVHAQSPSRDEIHFFEARIRPVLINSCYRCHSEESGRARGGLRVDSRDALLRGGDSGPAIVPGSPGESLLYRALLYDHPDLVMPPNGKLPDEVIADIRRWIRMGAPDPRASDEQTDHVPVQSEVDIDAGRAYWAYQPLAAPPPPVALDDGWARSTIDRFVQQHHEAIGLQPTSDAEAPVLVRRLHFVLIGLPPTPTEMERWTAEIEQSPSLARRQEVIGRLIDELLASPRYGERWGRHWMDVARYAESTGGDHNNVFQHAWRYRDYVVDAFNGDKPFDQFVREQIAGDLLPIADDAEWANNVIATGFLALGVKNVGEEDQERFFADLVDEQIDATTRAFLATTVSCARCHDHKFDPIPQVDYFAMAGVFRSTETHYGLISAQARQSTTLLDLTGLGHPAGVPPLTRPELQALSEARDESRAAVDEAMRRIRSGENVFRGTLRRLRSQRDAAEAALQSYADDGMPRVFAMGTQDRDHALATHLLIRGELNNRAQEVPRGVLQVLSPRGRHSFSDRTDGSGRLELAEWIASKDNALTARVIANRVWQWMFGRGLVQSVDDFGRAGTPPTHPELLDYLALRLVELDWSIKALIREIAMSRTWQLSSQFDPPNFDRDPENERLWRWSPRRLEAEVIRDALLAVSGELELEPPLGTYLQIVGEGGVGQNVFEPVIRSIEPRTRSVYLPRVRDALPHVLALFDAPDASLVMGARETTLSPLQALFLMNNAFVQERAIALASHVTGRTHQERIENLYHRLFGRPPTATERSMGIAFLAAQSNESNRGGRGGGAMSPLAVYCQALLATMEFQMID
jgi:cytochrome c553